MKLVVAETETAALLAWIDARAPVLVASDLVRTELMRAVRRTQTDRSLRARHVLDSVTLVTPLPTTFEAAGRLEPLTLRSLDAIHLATALEFGDELAGFLTYDDRFAEAARELGVAVIAPG